MDIIVFTVNFVNSKTVSKKKPQYFFYQQTSFVCHGIEVKCKTKAHLKARWNDKAKANNIVVNISRDKTSFWNTLMARFM